MTIYSQRPQIVQIGLIRAYFALYDDIQNLGPGQSLIDGPWWLN